jgi:hypothetical protein
MKRFLLVIGVAVMLSVVMVPAASAADMIVVATKATFKKAQPWVDFLKSKEVPVKNVLPSEFAKYQGEPYVVLMGGMDEAGGIKDLAKKALTPEEFTWITTAGNKKIYTKFNVWTGGQEVMIFAAADGPGAQAVRKETRDEWWETVSEWFELEEEAAGEGGTPAY